MEWSQQPAAHIPASPRSHEATIIRRIAICPALEVYLVRCTTGGWRSDAETPRKAMSAAAAAAAAPL